jgi:hypothetical protein
MVTLDVGQRRSSSPGTAASTACRKLRNSAARCRRRARSPPSGAASARRRETCCTVAADRPHAATTERVLQGMAFSGVVSSVQVSRAAICSSVRGRGTPRRGAGPGALPAGPRQSARALCRPRVSWWPAPRRSRCCSALPSPARRCDSSAVAGAWGKRLRRLAPPRPPFQLGPLRLAHVKRAGYTAGHGRLPA